MDYWVYLMLGVVLLLTNGLLAFLIWRMYSIEQFTESLGDFVHDKFNELEKRVEGIEKYSTDWHTFMSQTVLPEVDYMDFKLDAIRLDYYRHTMYYYHLDQEKLPARPAPSLQTEINLCSLEKSLKDRASKYEQKLNLIRPEGL